MKPARLEAFSDGVIAILITIMVLELHVPKGAGIDALQPLLPVLLSYALSFINLGIFWNNHHHMLLVTKRINGKILWANLHLLFWLSLIPYVTGWMGNYHLAPVPTASYGTVLLLAAVAWTILQREIIADQGPASALAAAVGRDVKGKLSALLYASAIPLAFVSTWLSDAFYVAVAVMWLVPDPRIESRLQAADSPHSPETRTP
jgi:uncharacterized membrane protein